MPTKRFVPAPSRRRRFIRNQHREYRTSLSKRTFKDKDVLDVETVKKHQERIKNCITKKNCIKKYQDFKREFEILFFLL